MLPPRSSGGPRRDALPPRPRRSNSMLMQHKNQHLPPLPTRNRSPVTRTKSNLERPNTLTRRPSMEPGAAGGSRRPDPPGMIRSVSTSQLLRPPRRRPSGTLVPPRTLPPSIVKDPIYKSKTSKKVVKKQDLLPPRRTASMPLFKRPPPTPKRTNVPSPDKSPQAQPIFLARRSKSIAKTFDHQLTSISNNKDVWVERVLLRGNGNAQVYFQSVFSRDCQPEPPTGATHVVYMDDLVQKQHQHPIDAVINNNDVRSSSKKKNPLRRWASSMGLGKQKVK